MFHHQRSWLRRSGGMNAGILIWIHHETVFKADFFPVGKDELNAWSFRHKKDSSNLKNESVILAPPEAIIVSKLEYYREGKADKHLGDIRSILAMSGDQIEQICTKMIG